jgi:23S rRNA (uracil1939-C5)-methyltransferase
MLVVGQTVSLEIEKPAVGGRMIARVDGQVVLVDGAIPGERVIARVDRVGRGVAFAQTVEPEQASPDRREMAADRLCGGCLYAHIAYERQLEIKAQVIRDGFVRIGRLPAPDVSTVAASPVQGYRMRARLHVRNRRIGFFREGTHEVCDVRSSGQLLAETCDVVDRLEAALQAAQGDAGEIEIAENLDASERVAHLDAPGGLESERGWQEQLLAAGGVTGLTVAGRSPAIVRVLSGSAYVSDALTIPDCPPIRLRRHVMTFFQGNRFLLRDLVAHVIAQLPPNAQLIDLYAGVGLFAIASAQARGATVTAVEGDRAAAEDLAANAALAGPSIKPVHQAVEIFARSAPSGADVVVVDPPRTGMSGAAVQGLLHLEGRRIVYVSCDVATLARDSRRIVDAGYTIARVDAFDMFPNTPHVETVVVFDRDKNTRGMRKAEIGSLKAED